jgi:hypothetical protein
MHYYLTGSLSNGTLHILRWKDQNGGKKTFRLVDRVSAGWKEFGTLLGITQNQLGTWEEQYCGDINTCWTKIMECWLNGIGRNRYPPTWEGLYELLDDAQYSQVAEELKNAVDECAVVERTSEDSSVSADGVSAASTVNISANEVDENATACKQINYTCMSMRKTPVHVLYMHACLTSLTSPTPGNYGNCNYAMTFTLN